MSSDLDPAEALGRAIRRTLTASEGGSLQQDLAAAVLDAASEVLVGRDECTVAELNELFDLDWLEPHWTVTFDDPEDRAGDITSNFNTENDVLDVLGGTVTDWSLVGRTPEGTATMMSDTGISLYEFTVDDGIYFCRLAEPDVCESTWWLVHAVDDNETRAKVIRDTRATFGMSDD